MITYRKSSIKPLGGLFNFGPSRGGLIREGSLFTKSSDKGIFGSFQFFYPIFCGINTVFISNHIKINMQGCIAK